MRRTPWVSTVRRYTGLIEHICDHGVGHPAVASADYLAIETQESRDDLYGNSWMVHGCDGCCGTNAWKQADLINGLQKANEILSPYATGISDDDGYQHDGYHDELDLPIGKI